MFNKVPSIILILAISIIISFTLYKSLPLLAPNFTYDTQDLAAAFALIFIITSAVYEAIKGSRLKQFSAQISIWIVIVFAIITAYSFRGELSYVAFRVASSIMPSYGVNYRPGEILITRSSDGHFYVQTMINNTPIKFMIDTGASDVALTKQDALKLAFDLKKLNYSKMYATANGLSAAAPIVLKSLAIGPKKFENIKASVTSGENDISLLGMSVISRFKSFKIDGDRLILGY